MLTKFQKDLIEDALSIESMAAKEAGTLGYMARVLVQATIPHSQQEGNEFIRSNGALTLSILSPAKVGLPYGTIPRLLLAWITTEAVRTKSPELILGESLSQFMRELDLTPTGGRWGSITRLKEQMQRLLSSNISCSYEHEQGNSGANMNIARKHQFWWDPKSPDQAALWQSNLTLSTDFFNEIIDRPIPIDFRALKALKRSPMALDIYNWLTYRMSYLPKATTIPWEALQLQFGSDYAETYAFKRRFLEQLRKVSAVYKDAKVYEDDKGLLLHPSPPHVKKLNT